MIPFANTFPLHSRNSCTELGDVLEYNPPPATGKWMQHSRTPWHLFISHLFGSSATVKNINYPKFNHKRKYVDLIKFRQWLQTLAIAAVSSLPNIIELAKITKVQVQVKPRVEFRNTRPRVKCLQTKCWRRGCDDNGVNTVVFYD